MKYSSSKQEDSFGQSISLSSNESVLAAEGSGQVSSDVDVNGNQSNNSAAVY